MAVCDKDAFILSDYFRSTVKPFSFSSWAKADEFGEGKSSSPNPISNNRKSVYDDKVDVGLNDETL